MLHQLLTLPGLYKLILKFQLYLVHGGCHVLRAGYQFGCIGWRIQVQAWCIINVECSRQLLWFLVIHPRMIRQFRIIQQGRQHPRRTSLAFKYFLLSIIRNCLRTYISLRRQIRSLIHNLKLLTRLSFISYQFCIIPLRSVLWTHLPRISSVEE